MRRSREEGAHFFRNNQSEQDTGLTDMHMSHFWSRFTDLDLFFKDKRMNKSYNFESFFIPFVLTTE